MNATLAQLQAQLQELEAGQDAFVEAAKMKANAQLNIEIGTYTGQIATLKFVIDLLKAEASGSPVQPETKETP